MKRIVLIVCILISFLQGYAQEGNPLSTYVDSLYKEDQFYVAVTYNLLGNKPKDVSQTGFSSGFHFGAIKDMPINKKRNVAIGLGIGYSANSFNQNLLISEGAAGGTNYSILTDAQTYTRNKFSMHLIEVPFEFRWRTSTPTEYKFWRIYTGFKLGYVLFNNAKFKGDSGSFKYKDIADVRDFQYGLTLSVGYNTWNLHVYYGLSSIFSDNAMLDTGGSIDVNTIKVGLMFYIL